MGKNSLGKVRGDEREEEIAEGGIEGRDKKENGDSGERKEGKRKKFSSIEEIIATRRYLWEKTRDIKEDEKFVAFAYKEIATTGKLTAMLEKTPWLLIEATFTVVDKKRHTIPFFFNSVQRDFVKQLEKYGTKKPYFILKGRQQGFTSLVTAIQLACAITRKNFSGLTVADCSDNSLAIFNDKAKRVYNSLPDIAKPHEKYNSTRELYFDKLNSSWRVATATEDVGRSRTLNFLHLSEIAFYQVSLSRLQSGLLEATTEDCLVVYETTANGFNEAKALWDSGSCVNLFYRWWESEEYTASAPPMKLDGYIEDKLAWLKGLGLSEKQLNWYAAKYNSFIDKNLLRQEYPCSPEDAFVGSSECVFDSDALVKRLAEREAPSRKGDFRYKKSFDEEGNGYIEEFAFVEDKNGIITIFDQPRKDVTNSKLTK